MSNLLNTELLSEISEVHLIPKGEYYRLGVCGWKPEIHSSYQTTFSWNFASSCSTLHVGPTNPDNHTCRFFLDPEIVCSSDDNSKLNHQRWRRLRKRHLKSEFRLPQTFLHLFHLIQFIKCWQICLDLNSTGLYRSSGND